MDQPVNPSDIIGRKRRRGFTGGPSRYARGVGQVNVRPAASNDIPPLRAEPRLGAIWVAESDARLVGYLIAVLVLSVEHQGLMGEIDEFFVLPEARASGIGTQLLAAAETALAARGCVRLQLQLGVGNSAARAFHQHRGYTARAGYELLDKPLGVTTCQP